jgi:drug/metabolite transporter (DMT)-like permease
MPPVRSRQLVADTALLLVAAVWGATFPLTALLLEYLPPFLYLATRFAFSSLLLIGVLVVRGEPLGPLRGGLRVGLALAVGYAAQTLGIPLAGATVAAFLTGLSVLLVPPVGILFRHSTAPADWLAVLVGTVGLALLTMREGHVRFGAGEAILCVCALAIAFQIVLSDRAARRMSPLQLSASQNTVVALVCAIGALFEPAQRVPPPAWVWPVVFAFGAVASAAAFVVQSWAQRFTPPAHVGLIFAAEPLFAALFAWWWIGERLSARQWLGALVLVGAMVYAGFARGKTAGEENVAADESGML